MKTKLLNPKLHGYGYVYRYRKDTDTRIRQFSKKPDTRICLLLKKIIIIIIMQRHKVFPPPIIIMASPEWSQFMLVPRYFIRNMAPAYQLLTAGPTYHTLHFLSTHSPHPVALHSLSLLPSLSPGRRRRSSGLPRRHRARQRQARQVRRAATGSGRRRGRGGPTPIAHPA